MLGQKEEDDKGQDNDVVQIGEEKKLFSRPNKQTRYTWSDQRHFLRQMIHHVGCMYPFLVSFQDESRKE
jgi:hypothetical protein